MQLSVPLAAWHVVTATAASQDTIQACASIYHWCSSLLTALLQADIYSLGVLLWELVTSDVPQRGRMRPVKVVVMLNAACWMLHMD